jgi:hypothetical protein
VQGGRYRMDTYYHTLVAYHYFSRGAFFAVLATSPPTGAFARLGKETEGKKPPLKN